MTTMKHYFRFFYFTLSMVVCICCNAEEGIPCLAGSEWQYYEPGSMDYNQGVLRNVVFSSDTVRYNSYWYPLKKSSIIVKPYYQSDVKPTSFDFSQVGKGNGGRYFVKFNLKLNEMEYCEITKCTEDSLVLFFEGHPNYIGGVEHSITYTRVK